MTVQQLARATHSVFELHHESLTGLPSSPVSPELLSGGLCGLWNVGESSAHTQHTVTVVKGDTRDRRESHYWLEIDGLVYDLTWISFKKRWVADLRG